MPRIDDLFLVSTGHRHGSVEVSSEELESRFGLTEGWSEKYLGMTSRRRLPDGNDIAPLAIEAMRDALDRVQWSGTEIDLLVCGSSFVDQHMPPTSSHIANTTNPNATSFDVNATCAGFPYAITVAAALTAWDPSHQKVAVCMAENASAYIDHDSSESSIFWGDAAGAALIQRGPRPGSFEIVGAELTNDSRVLDFVRVPRHGTFQHNGPVSYKEVLRLSEAVGRRALGLIGAEGPDVRAFVGHQSSTRLLADVARALDIPVDRQWQNVSWAGNQSGAGALTALSGGWHEHSDDLVDGDLVLIAAAGAGATAGALLLRWHA